VRAARQMALQTSVCIPTARRRRVLEPAPGTPPRSEKTTVHEGGGLAKPPTHLSLFGAVHSSSSRAGGPASWGCGVAPSGRGGPRRPRTVQQRYTWRVGRSLREDRRPITPQPGLMRLMPWYATCGKGRGRRGGGGGRDVGERGRGGRGRSLASHLWPITSSHAKERTGPRMSAAEQGLRGQAYGMQQTDWAQQRARAGLQAACEWGQGGNAWIGEQVGKAEGGSLL
jgi:hypothetical protein